MGFRGIFGKRNSVNQLIVVALWLCSVYLTYFYSSKQVVARQKDDVDEHFNNREIKMAKTLQDYVYERKTLDYSREMPLIFVGGMPRSGTTLMRTMLDAHPDVRCGQETRIIPRILGMRSNWLKSPKERVRLEEAGITSSVVNDAIAQFILEVIVKHGKAAPFLCNKDPFTLKSLKYLRELFPNSKYLLMLRDGRATAHSIIARKVTITGFDITSYRDVLMKWNRAIETMFVQCMEVGAEICMPVRYEQLVLRPLSQTKHIFEFLGIPWNENVVNHEQHMANVSLSNVEKSTDQVVRPLYLDALSSWFGHIPDDVARDMNLIAPMLAKLGYDPMNPRPTYGEPDELVRNKTRLNQKVL